MACGIHTLCRIAGTGRRLARILLLFVICGCLMISACGPTVAARNGLDTELSGPVWPREPSRARIRWVSEIRGPADLGIRDGVLSRFWNWVSGKQPPRIVRPHDVAVDARGRLWVTDPGAHAVHVFDLKGGRYQVLPKRPRDKIQSPIAVTHDTEGTAYVSDSALGLILRFNARGDMLPSWDAGGELVRPTGVAFAPEEHLLWVVDSGAHRLVALDERGAVQRAVGGRGDKPGEFNYPTHLAIDGAGRFYVTDTLNFRVQVLSSSGVPLFTLGRVGDGPGALLRPKGADVDGEGHIYVVDALFENVQIFDDQGRLLLYFGEPGAGAGQFWLPAGLEVTDGNRIYIADGYNKRVQVFEYLGN